MRLELNLADQEERDLFLQEVDEQLQILDEDLVRLEKEAENGDLLQEIFRAAHTLKGSSASVGHVQMAELTHHMEGLLDKLRRSELVVSTAIVDALLEGLDALRVLQGQVITMEAEPLELNALFDRLAAIQVERENENVAPAVQPAAAGGCDLPWPDAAESMMEGEGSCVQIQVRLDESGPFNAARCWQALSRLSEMGQVVRSIPSEAEVEQEKVETSLQVLFAPGEGCGDIVSILRGIPDITSVVVTPWQAAPPVEERGTTPVTAAPPAGQADRRVIDLGPDARGKPAQEQLAMAAQKVNNLNKTVRIDVERLDTLMNLIGELVIDQGRLQRIGASLEGASRDHAVAASFAETSLHVGRVCDQLQQQVMKARLLPIETVFNRFPRLVRDLAAKLGRKVDFIVEGKETELDRSVIEEIGDPLVHLLRNAVDHGLESPEQRLAAGKPEMGTIRLSAKHEEGHIAITVEDDGGGIDPHRVLEAAVTKNVISDKDAAKLSESEAINLIFAPGFSTATRVTDVSGRGVGLDIVKTNVEKLGGTIEVVTRRGEGTRFHLQIPLTLAIIQALLVTVRNVTYAIPVSSVMEATRVRPGSVKTVGGREVVVLRGALLPLVRLASMFDDEASLDTRPRFESVVVVRSGQRMLGLVVDSLLGQQQIVIKNLGALMGDRLGVAGATILGDGRVGLILDVPSLVRNAVSEQRRAEAAGELAAAGSTEVTVDDTVHNEKRSNVRWS